MAAVLQKYKLDDKLKLDAPNQYGDTVIHFLIRHHNCDSGLGLQILQLLVDNCCNASIPNREGRQPEQMVELGGPAFMCLTKAALKTGSVHIDLRFCFFKFFINSCLPTEGQMMFSFSVMLSLNLSAQYWLISGVDLSVIKKHSSFNHISIRNKIHQHTLLPCTIWLQVL